MALGHDISYGLRTQDVKISEDVLFDTMLLAESTLKGLRKSGFVKPSPIQLHGIPLGKCGFDLLLEAKSGTGKTAVFAVIALEKLDLSLGVQTIILAPTREIASQICDVINVIGAYYKGLNVAVVMGGLPVKEDIEKFKENVHIVVGSPGRLRHLIHDKHIDVSHVRLFVLDEADKLMEQSFLPDINYIFSLLPKQKQVVMSSATYPTETKTFIGNYVKKAQHVCPDTNSVLLGIEQKVIIVPYNCNIVKQTKHRYEELKKILSSKEFKQCLIFCNYQVRVAELHRLLNRDKWPSEQLYGNQDQSDRLDALKTLQEYKCRILVSTDLAARGIDASNVDLVINFEPPSDWQTYLHRIGRAGRYGSYGLAVCILSEGKEKSKFQDTLLLSKMAFNLKHYWTDETLNLNSTENSLGDNVSVNSSETASVTFGNGVINKDVITEIAQEINIKQDILSFDELLDSFKNACEINETINKDEQDLEYKHLKLNKSPTTDVKNGNNHFLNGHSKLEKENVKVENTRLNGEKEPVNMSQISNYKTKKLNIKDKLAHNGINVEDLSEINNEVKLVMKTKDTEYDAEEQALLDAGLPLAFGKPKNSHKYPRNTKNRHLCDIEKKINEPIESQTKVHSSFKECSVKQYNKSKNLLTIKQSYKNDEFYSSSDSIQSFEEIDELKQNIWKCRKPLHRVSKDYTKITQDNSYENNAYSREQRSLQFDNWYKQLKSQSQFIQYALYIEELNKL